MKCIILGASGFLGKACIDELHCRGDEVIAFDRTVKLKKVTALPMSLQP